MSELLIDGQPLPRRRGIALESDLYGSRAFWTERRLDEVTGMFSVTRKLGRLPVGARVTVDGRLVHVEGALEQLQRASL